MGGNHKGGGEMYPLLDQLLTGHVGDLIPRTGEFPEAKKAGARYKVL